MSAGDIRGTHTLLAVVQFCFWICLAVLFYTFAGYPLLVIAWSRLRPRQPIKRIPEDWPEVSYVLILHNEQGRTRARIENLLAGDYPHGKIEVVVVSDGSTDGTEVEAREMADPRVRVLVRRTQSGKAECLNAAVAEAKGEILIFADARQRFSADTARALVVHFSDSLVGAVSGSLEVARAASTIGAGVDGYWRFEKAIRAAEGSLDSCIGCTGAVYAIRRRFFRPLPADTILDDVVTPMEVALQGFRVTFEPSAIAFDPQELEPAREQIRKQRTLAGNFQMLCRYSDWVLPWHNRLWWQLVSHKYLRLLAPVMLLSLLALNLLLRNNPAYLVVLWIQLLCYALAAAGMVLKSTRTRLLSFPAAFLFLNVMTVRGFWYFLRAGRSSGWVRPCGSGPKDPVP